MRPRVTRWRDPNKPKQAHPEANLQRQVCDYLSWALAPPAWFTAIAHGARLSSEDGEAWLRGAILKGTGTKSGVPDILIIVEGRAYFIELKAKRGVLSEAQRRVQGELIAAGCQSVVCRSLDEVRGALWGWNIALRETKPDHVMDGLRAALQSV